MAYEEGFSFPPDTTIGLASELADREAPEAREAFLHAPSEWSTVLKYAHDAELMNKLNNLTQVSASKYRKLVSLLREVALELNRRIDEFVPSTYRADGFLVVHSDFDGEDLARNEAALRRDLKTLHASRP